MPLLCLAFGLVRPLPAGAAPQSLCYQKLSGQAGSADVEQLRLDLDGQRVAGFYRWLPWQKDRRVGRLDGRLVTPGTARVLYRFQQEGQASTAPLTIVFDDRQARISWDIKPGPSAQPMPPALLPRNACTRLKPVPGL